MDKQDVANSRKSNLELLRILATLLIVAFHCVEHIGNGEFSVLGESFSFNVATSVLFGSWGTLGVDIFIILSCWFLVDAEGIRLHKIIILGLQTWFLSLLVTGIVSAVGEKVTFETIVKEFLTPFYNQFWFVSAYILFYLCVPLFQKSLTQLSNRDLKRIVVVGGAVVSLYRFIFGVGEGGELATFSYLFYVIAYLKRTPNNFIERHCIKLSFANFLAIGGV